LYFTNLVSDCAASLTGYVASTATAKTKQKTKTAGTTETGVQDGPALPAIFSDVIMSTTFRYSRVCFARAPFKATGKERNK